MPKTYPEGWIVTDVQWYGLAAPVPPFDPALLLPASPPPPAPCPACGVIPAYPDPVPHRCKAARR